MPDEIRVNKVSAAQSASQAASLAAAQPSPSRMPWVILAIVVAVIAILGVLFREKLFGGGKQGETKGVATSNYQAVFLTNGQVYFGKVSNANSDYVTLSDIFYLQVVQPPLQGQQQPGQETQPTPNQPQISLVKLGNELHAPVDEMKINREHILFYEDLKAEGQVVQAINNYKTSPAAAPQK